MEQERPLADKDRLAPSLSPAPERPRSAYRPAAGAPSRFVSPLAVPLLLCGEECGHFHPRREAPSYVLHRAIARLHRRRPRLVGVILRMTSDDSAVAEPTKAEQRRALAGLREAMGELLPELPAAVRVAFGAYAAKAGDKTLANPSRMDHRSPQRTEQPGQAA